MTDEPRAQAGAAGLMLAAIGQDATEIETDAVDAGLMKLFMLPRPKAQALRKEAASDPGVAASDAASLQTDERERLIGLLWQLGGEGAVLTAAGEAFGMTQERLAALRPAEGGR